MNKKLVTSSFALLFALATALHAETTEAAPPQTATSSFAIVDKHTSNLIRVKPGADWGSYQAFRIVPAVYEPEGAKHRLTVDEARRITTGVDRSLRSKFKETGEVVGPVLEIRPVVTSFQRTNTLLNVIGFAAIQAPISFGGASVRYELLDGRSGEAIGEVSLKRNARPWNVYPWDVLYNFEAIGQGSVILKSDSGRLRRDLVRLSKLNGEAAPDRAATAAPDRVFAAE